VVLLNEQVTYGSKIDRLPELLQRETCLVEQRRVEAMLEFPIPEPSLKFFAYWSRMIAVGRSHVSGDLPSRHFLSFDPALAKTK
jgi:hypothetical protein